tara:strand:- start:660 stop:827 length:168 start_codon:yes stop_codon:yes gene_type:complete
MLTVLLNAESYFQLGEMAKLGFGNLNILKSLLQTSNQPMQLKCTAVWGQLADLLE